MTTRGPYLCMACTRFDWSTMETCAAYPNGIPVDIISGADHRTPRGDEVGGRVFEPVSTPNAGVVLEAWEAMSR